MTSTLAKVCNNLAPTLAEFCNNMTPTFSCELRNRGGTEVVNELCQNLDNQFFGIKSFENVVVLS